MERLLRHLCLATALAVSAILPSCTSEGGSGSPGPDPTLTLAITDAPSDDIESFLVDVTQVQLTKLGGDLVNVMATPARVDLASLAELSQIVSIGNVPVGTYLEAEVTIDFTNASCMLVGQTTPATILDADGNPLTGTLVLPINFGSNDLVCPANRHKLLEFDFDLDQSVATDLVGNTVSIEPSFSMNADPSDPKPLLAVGRLVSVDTLTSTFVMEVRTLDDTLLASATLHSGSSTIWHLDGVSSTGDPGLTALAAMSPGTWIQIVAVVDPIHPEFDVVYVEAGAGTYNGGDDIVEGHIVDRVGAAGTDPTLTVLGHSTDAAHTTLQFNTTFTVTASAANTKVVRVGVDQAFDTDELSVGQRVRIFGALTGTTMDATSATSVVKLLPTRVLGFASGAPGLGVLTIDLVRVDLRLETAFNWPGGGLTPPDPNVFEIAVGTLGNGLGIGPGTPVEARGFFAPVDDATEDFDASSLTNRALAPSLVLIRNRPLGMNVLIQAFPAEIEMGLAGTPGVGEFAILDQGFVGSQDLPFLPTPSLVPSVNGPRFYVLRDKALNTSTLFFTFSAFSAAVENKIGLGADIVQIAAIGHYAPVENRVEAQLASVIVE